MKKPISHTIAILVSLVLLVTACGPTEEPTVSPLTGALSELRGIVNSKQAEEADFHAVITGEVLQVNGQVQTGDDGHVRIDLSSGTIIRVVPTSLFTLVSNEPAEGGLTTKLKLELGRIFIILNGGSMDVETPSGVASVAGSYMMVEIDPLTQDVIVTCLEGTCGAGTEQLTNGQKVTFHYDPSTGQYGPPKLENMNDEDFQNWLNENPESKSIIEHVLADLLPPSDVPTEAPTAPPATEAPVASTTPPCFKLVSPLSDVQLNLVGPVTFSWEAQTGAEKYQVIFSYPDGSQTAFETTNTDMTRYMETMPGAGQYSWQVTALNASNEPMCTTEAYSFSKLDIAQDLMPPTDDEQQFVCTIETSQWNNPRGRCYCDQYADTLPPYCGGG